MKRFTRKRLEELNKNNVASNVELVDALKDRVKKKERNRPALALSRESLESYIKSDPDILRLIWKAMIHRAQAGDVVAFQIIRDTLEG